MKEQELKVGLNNYKDLNVFISADTLFLMEKFNITLAEGYSRSLRVPVDNPLLDAYGNPVYNDHLQLKLDPKCPKVFKKTSNSVLTALKELIGERIIEYYELWEELFPDHISVEKVTDRKRQKAGLDFIVVTKDKERVGVDLKSIIGEYLMKPEYYKDIPLRSEMKKHGTSYEICQYSAKYNKMVFTNGPSKINKYFLYIHSSQDGIRYVLLDKMKVEMECLKYWPLDRKVCSGKYVPQESNNGSAYYIMVPQEWNEVEL